MVPSDRYSSLMFECSQIVNCTSDITLNSFQPKESNPKSRRGTVLSEIGLSARASSFGSFVRAYSNSLFGGFTSKLHQREGERGGAGALSLLLSVGSACVRRI